MTGGGGGDGGRSRVLIVDDAIGVWGAQHYVVRMAGPLAERGIDLALAAPAGAFAEAWRARGLAFHQLEFPPARSVRAGGRRDAPVRPRLAAREAAALIGHSAAIGRAAREVGAELIWANSHAVHLDAAVAGRRAGLPTVLHLHEDVPRAFGRIVRTAAVGMSTRSVAVCDAIVASLPRPLAGRVQVIRNGVDVERFRPVGADPQVRASLGARSGSVLVVTLTRLDPEKRIEDLIAAMARLPDDPPWHLAVVGATSVFPSYAAGVEALARQRLGDRVTFAGRREDVAEVLSAADLMAHTGTVEGTPLVVLEAQACGTPVIAYRMGGVPEHVVDGVTGLLAPPLAVPDLTDRIRALIADAERRARMAEAARSHVVANHRIEAQIEQHAELLATQLATPARQRSRPSM